jgi:eukaryotic-like serine/threonine-protein kinase
MESKGPAPVPEGYLLASKYRIEKVIGAGGMGVVVSATHVHLGQRVAIKFLLPHAVEDEQTVLRFAREARALARLESEHVARVIDVGALETGEPYMVLECLTGRTLAALLDANGTLEVRDAVSYVLDACHALAEAHSLGIVHRDIKPENLFLADRADGTRIVKVIDFGVSKVSADQATLDAPVTTTSAVVGSPLYMSPEQLRAARDVDARTDIWALGVTLYELLTAQGPFCWSTLPELCAAILKDDPRPLRGLRPDVPEALESVVMACLAREPSLRPVSAAELARALRPFSAASAVVPGETTASASFSVRASFLLASAADLTRAEMFSLETLDAPFPDSVRCASGASRVSGVAGVAGVSDAMIVVRPSSPGALTLRANGAEFEARSFETTVPLSPAMSLIMPTASPVARSSPPAHHACEAPRSGPPPSAWVRPAAPSAASVVRGAATPASDLDLTPPNGVATLPLPLPLPLPTEGLSMRSAVLGVVLFAALGVAAGLLLGSPRVDEPAFVDAPRIDLPKVTAARVLPLAPAPTPLAAATAAAHVEAHAAPAPAAGTPAASEEARPAASVAALSNPRRMNRPASAVSAPAHPPARSLAAKPHRPRNAASAFDHRK